MRGFTRSLGVRCTHCHVGEEGKPLGSYDFVSDKNPNKDRAREMYRMLGDINAHLKKITPSAEPRVNMWCGTCHRGRPRPTTLGEEMSEARQEVRDRRGACPLSRASRPVRGRRNLRLSRTDSRGFRRGSRRRKRLRGSDRRPQAQRRGVSEVERCLGGPGGGTTARRERRELAVLSYRKALELDAQNDGARQALRELEAPKAP